MNRPTLGRLARCSTAVLVASVWAAVAATSVTAHAVLIGSEPSERAIVAAAPSQIRLFFSEPVDPEFFDVQVYDQNQKRVDRGDAHISASDVRTVEVGLQDVPMGTYVVVWRVVSLDTHPVRDSFPFTVGAGVVPAAVTLDLPPVGMPASVDTLTRWLTDLSALLLIGGFAFPPLVLGPKLDARLTRRWLGPAWFAVGSLLALTFVSLAFQAASAAGVPALDVLRANAVSQTLSTRFGTLLIVREVAALGLAGVVAALSVTAARHTRWTWWLGVVIAAGILLTISTGGHSATTDTPVTYVLVDWIHLVAGGFWLGGLLQLGLLLAGIPHGGRLGGIVKRFSTLALISMSLLIVTGLGNSMALVIPAGWSAWTDTAYGAVLSGKLVLVALVLGVAAIDLLVITRSIQRAEHVARLIRNLVVAELALGLGVVGVTAVLVGQPPSVSIPLVGKPFVETHQTSDLTETLAVSPNQAGDNHLSVGLTDAAGRPLTDQSARVHLALTMLEMEMGTRQVDTQSDGRGDFAVSGGYLSMPGRWRADVQLTRGEGAQDSTSFNLVVGQAPGVSRPAFSPAYILYLAVTDPDRAQNAPPVNPLFVAMVACLFAGALLIGARWRFASAPMGSPFLVLAAVLLSATLGFGGLSIAQAFRKSLPNPVPADSASIDRGKAVYQRCVACHGVAGRGDGPAGRTLNPRPADFRIHMAAGHTDRQLFDWISKGIDGTAMPAFGEQLSDQERWDVINFIRTFAAQ